MNSSPESNFTTKPIRKVLIALDYDQSAQQVAQMGYSIAKAMSAEVVLLHVLTDVTYYSTPGYTPIMGFSDFSHAEFLQMIDVNGLKDAGRHYLERIKNHLGQDAAISTVIEEGDVATMVLKTSLRSHIDIIVIGSHSRNWVEKVLMGSTAEKVLGQTTKPLLIIPVKDEGSSK